MKYTENFYRIVGHKIREVRLKAQISQSELGRRISLSRGSISNIENGRQNLLFEQAFNIARAVDIDISSILPSSAELPSKKQAGIKDTSDKNEIAFIERVLVKGGK